MNAILEWTFIPTWNRDLEICGEGQPLTHQVKGREFP